MMPLAPAASDKKRFCSLRDRTLRSHGVRRLEIPKLITCHAGQIPCVTNGKDKVATCFPLFKTERSDISNKKKSKIQITTTVYHLPITWLSMSMFFCECLDAGCGIIVISSLIFSGFNSESPDLLLPGPGAFLLSIAFFATVLCAE